MPTKKRGTPRRAKKPAKRPTTALVRRQPIVPVVDATPVPERILTEGTHLGELGLVPIKFTDQEEKVLSEPAPLERLRVKPDGAVYLPHADYTRWLNRALGRGSWMLVPVGVPSLANKTVVCPYVLYIHGKPAAFAQGEQEYFEGNRNQSYGDALESTVASALRRTTKHLGIASELWDRDFTDPWRAEHCVKVWTKSPRDEKPRPMWRRKVDPPLPYEQKGRGDWNPGDYPEEGEHPEQERQPRRSSNAPPPATQHAHAGEPITNAQRMRLVTITQNSGRDEAEVVEWLQKAYGYQGTKDVRRQDYDAICRAIENQGDLPRGKAR